MDDIDHALTHEVIDVDDAIRLGELWSRLQPIQTGWSHQLDRQAQDRIRGLASAKSDPELQRMYSRLGAIIGRLRPYANLVFAGTSAEFPVTLDHIRFAAEVRALQAKESRNATP
jgi:hypothetical protein